MSFVALQAGAEVGANLADSAMCSCSRPGSSMSTTRWPGCLRRPDGRHRRRPSCPGFAALPQVAASLKLGARVLAVSREGLATRRPSWRATSSTARLMSRAPAPSSTRRAPGTSPTRSAPTSRCKRPSPACTATSASRTASGVTWAGGRRACGPSKPGTTQAPQRPAVICWISARWLGRSAMARSAKRWILAKILAASSTRGKSLRPALRSVRKPMPYRMYW